jgi:hypothetical protein
MAVVIHEFEVDVQPPVKEARVSPAKSSSEPFKPAAQELERVLRREKERAIRVWAH